MTLKAGRELDALVAEKVMGLDVRQGGYAGGIGQHLRPYSRDIGAAWEVVEKLEGKGFSYHIETGEPGMVDAFFDTDVDSPIFWAAAKTAPHAICLAALKAVGIEAEQTSRAPPPPKDGSREQELQKHLYAEKKKEE